jgi:hypothetical protein
LKRLFQQQIAELLELEDLVDVAVRVAVLLVFFDVTLDFVSDENLELFADKASASTCAILFSPVLSHEFKYDLPCVSPSYSNPLPC